MKTSLVILASVLLIMGIVGVVYAATQQAVTASVTVTGVKSITVSNSSLAFGNMQPGESKAPTENPLVITIDANTGYSVTTESNSSLFTGGAGTLASTNLKFSNVSITGPWTTGYSTTPVTIGSGSAGGGIHNLWHNLTIPGGTQATGYTLGITLKVA